MLILPAIDLLNNKIVRLKKGDFNEVTYYETSPLEQAIRFKNTGFEWLHIVDLEASKSGAFTSLNLIKEIKESTGLKIEFGGGVRSLNDVNILLNNGVDKVIIGSLSVTNKNELEKIVQSVGADKIIMASDVAGTNIAIKGWTETSEVSIYDHIDYCRSLKLKTFLITDISRDGMLTGTNLELYKDLQKKYSDIQIIASGGIKDLEDVKKVNDHNFYGCIVGKAIYENKINIEELVKIGM